MDLVEKFQPPEADMRALLLSENFFLITATSLAIAALAFSASIQGMPWEVPTFFGGMVLGGLTFLGQGQKNS